MGGLLHLVQQGGAWACCGTNFRLFDVAVPIKALIQHGLYAAVTSTADVALIQKIKCSRAGVGDLLLAVPNVTTSC